MDTSLPLLSMTIFLPLLGAIMISLNWEKTGHNARWVALWTSFVTFIMTLVIGGHYDPSTPQFQLEDKWEWIPLMGTTYHVGIDGISLPFVILTAFLVPLCILASWTSIQRRVPEYMMVFLILETMILGVFTSLDFFLFYVFFEGSLIPLFFIIGIWGGPHRIYATFKFFLYTFLGSLFLLLAILYIYHEVGNSDILAALTVSFDPTLQTWLWLAFFLSFAVKIPMWPFHTWLPAAHVEAPTAGSMILAGILLKTGGYGFLRFSLPLFPDASLFFTPLIFALSGVAIVYASLVALVQKDIKKLIAYGSIAHMGFVTLGIFAADAQGIQGAIMQMISHGLISAALFFCVGVLYDRVHGLKITEYGGIAQRMPHYAVVFMIFTLASLGLPGTSGFVGEFLVLLGTYQVNTAMTLWATIGLVLGAAYSLWLYRRVIFGPLNPTLKGLSDLSPREGLIFAPLVIGVVGLGLYPLCLLKVIDTSVSHLIDQYTLATDSNDGLVDQKKNLDVALLF